MPKSLGDTPFEDTVKDSVSFIRDMEMARFNAKMTPIDWEIIGEIVMIKQKEAIKSYKSELIKGITDIGLGKCPDYDKDCIICKVNDLISLINNK